MILDKVLFKSKHWQMFLFYMVIVLSNAFFLEGRPGVRGDLGEMLHGWILISWGLLIGGQLKRKLPAYYEAHYKLFLISGVMFIVTTTLLSIFKQESKAFFDANEIVTIVCGVATIFFGLAFVGFLPRAMKSLQTNDRATVADYGNDVFLWLVYPVGVWWIQPRLNRIYNKHFDPNH